MSWLRQISSHERRNDRLDQIKRDVAISVASALIELLDERVYDMARSDRPDPDAWTVELLEEIRRLLAELVIQGGGTPPDPRPPWDRP